ncbi:MAG TPA: formate dehydrogenase [Halieaceae bacterium]|jgi:formate dehydrogenase subunit delta|nr:formate dehydrogenase [Halieaceae bacterium]|tara:strand:+ start:5808 stop:6047 length:240 start_codon:yes stop_codon:yes gene_type:complete
MNGELRHLVDMANQIATNLRFAAEDDAAAAELVANHIQRFWARNMKMQIADYVQADGAELNEVARLAVAALSTACCQSG